MKKTIVENTLKVSISTGNKKMHGIPSVSLPPVKTCVNCESCAHKCYAAKLCRIYPSVKAAYDRNYDILIRNRAAYFSQVKAAAILSGFFRWHVSGDIIDADYLYNMCKVARECKNTRFLVFTKNYDVINRYFGAGYKKPRNLQVIFSLPFDGATVDNPHNLPTAAVILKGKEPAPNYKICGGNCAECAACGIGCWELKKGETIAFYEH